MAEMLYALTSLVIHHGAGTAVDDHTEVWCLRIDQTQLRGSGVDINESSSLLIRSLHLLNLGIDPHYCSHPRLYFPSVAAYTFGVRRGHAGRTKAKHPPCTR